MSDGERRAKLAHARWRTGTLVRAGLIAPLRPDKYLRMGAVFRKYGVTPTTGLSLAAARRPNGVGLVDELGSLTWGELGRRSDALAAGIAAMRTPAGRPVTTVAILCRNHRGFVDSLGAAAKLGADALLLNTGFSGPQLADVVAREGAELVIYDEEFAGLVEHARTEIPDLLELVAWQDAPGSTQTLEQVIAAHEDRRPDKPDALRQGHPADVRHDRHPQGRQARGRRRHQRGRRDARPDPVALRAGHRRRRADVPRVGLRAARHLGDADLHGRHPPQVRPRGDPRDGPRPRRQRPGRRAGDDRADHGAAGRGARPLPAQGHPALRHRQRLADARRRGHRVHGPLRRHDLQQLQRHRGGADQHRGPGRPAGRARHGRQAGRRHRPADPRRRRPRGAAGRRRPDHGPQRLPVLRLHLGRHQGVPRRLHGLRRRRPGRRGRSPVRRRPRRRDDRVRRRERLPARGRGDAQRAPGRPRGRRHRGRRREVRPAAGGVRRPRAGQRRARPTTSRPT